MKRCYYLLLLIVISTSCNNSIVIESKPIGIIPKQDSLESKPYSDPIFFCGTGSSYGNYLQSLYRLNKFDDLLKFTSSGTRRRFRDEAVLGFYKNDFQFDFQLNKLTAIQKSGDTNFLIYSTAQSLGTRRKVILKTVIENDSVRLILDSMKNPFQFLSQ